MARTTPELIQGILMDNYGPLEIDGELPDLQPFVEVASSLVDDMVECAAAKGKVLSAAKLELIERWLGAHFYQQSDKGVMFTKTQDSADRYDGKTEMYLESTLFGQMAVTLDSSGCLAAIAKGDQKTVGMIWLGKRPSQQTDVWNRD